MGRKVFIYSVPRATATGISDFANATNGKRMKKVKIGKCTDILYPLYSRSVGGLKTGLYKPWIEDGKPKVEDGKTLTLQDKYEREHNRPKGFYTNAANLDYEKDNQKLTYFQTLKVVFEDGCTVLDLDEPDDLMRYHVCLESRFVANSEKEWKAHKFPDAEWYIALQNEEEDIKYEKNEAKSKAFATLHADYMTDTVKKKVASVLELINTKNDLPSSVVHNILFDYIDKSTHGINSNIEKYKEIIVLFDTADGRMKFESMYLIKQLLDYRIIYEKQDTYTWIRQKGSIVLGYKYDEALDFLMNPKKSSLVDELKQELKAKMI